MLRGLKFLALGMGGLLIILLLATVLLMNLVNPNSFKPQLRQYVQTATGRDLDIAGDISWTLLPRFGLKVTGLQLSNPPGFNGQPFVIIKQAEVKLAFLPLLKKQLVAQQLVLQGLQLNLIKAKSGMGNWQSRAQTFPQSPAVVTAPVLAAPLALHIAKLKIIDARVNYLDNQTAKQVAITHINFNADNLRFAHTFPVNLSLISEQPAATQAAVDFKARVNIDPQQQTYTLSDMVLQLRSTGSALSQHELQLKAQVKLTKQVLAFNSLNLLLDKQTTITGEIVKNLVTQVLNFHLTIPQLNLTANQTGQTTEVKNNTQQSSYSTAALLPLALLHASEAQGTVEINQLLSDKLQLNDILINISAQQGVIQLAPMQADLYQGKYQGQVTIDARGQVPTIKCQHSIHDLNLGQLLKDIPGPHRFSLQGRANINLQLTTLGNNVTTWLQNLGGTADFAIQQGTIHNIDVDYELQRIQNFICKEPPPKPAANPQTTFDKLSGTLQIAHGIANNMDLSLQSASLLAQGQGTIDLPKKTLDYKIQAKAVSKNLGNDFYRIQDSLGGNLPIVIAGPWEQPVVNPDWTVISQAIAKALLNKHSQEISSQLGEQLDKHLSKDDAAKLKQSLQQLFG